MEKVAVVIPTLNAGISLRNTLLQLLQANPGVRMMVVDSSSADGTPDLARRCGAEVISIDRASFNHGATREFARNVSGCEIAVMLTQDAEPVSDDLVARLISPIESGRAVVSYGRQIPRIGASVAESFPREFNYPPRSEIRNIGDLPSRGGFTFFCSNSCAAWNNAALDRVGGFPRVPTAEDTLAVARLLQAGGSIAYVADAVVRHSHAYHPMREFRRHFDTGYMRAAHAATFRLSSDQSRGKDYAKLYLSRTLRESPLAFPAAVAEMVTKYTGYVAGRLGKALPPAVCRRLSGTPSYWDHFRGGHAAPENADPKTFERNQ